MSLAHLPAEQARHRVQNQAGRKGYHPELRGFCAAAAKTDNAGLARIKLWIQVKWM